MAYKIFVQATVNREYLVEADSPDDAITKYRQGEGTLVHQADDETDPWPEDWDTAEVIMESTQDTMPIRDKSVLDRISRSICWYPFGCCHSKAETRVKETIGSDTMQYCKKHDTEMRRRYALEH